MQSVETIGAPHIIASNIVLGNPSKSELKTYTSDLSINLNGFFSKPTKNTLSNIPKSIANFFKLSSNSPTPTITRFISAIDCFTILNALNK